jgi:carbon monoxide dehydrogenase subunit G
MKVEGSHTIAAPRERVWEMLLDPAVLERTLPGCEKLEPDGENQFRVSAKIGLAAVRGAYTGTVRLTDLDPPQACTLVLEGKGGPGFLRGHARVRLSAQGESTLLDYQADVQVGGLMAAIGQRMLQGMASTLLAVFFQNFEKEAAGARPAT